MEELGENIEPGAWVVFCPYIPIFVSGTVSTLGSGPYRPLKPPLHPAEKLRYQKYGGYEDHTEVLLSSGFQIFKATSLVDSLKRNSSTQSSSVT